MVALDGHPTKFAPGERFSYCNGGYVVLALIAERVSGVPFHELVIQRVCVPAGMPDTEFLRSDKLPRCTALGYLQTDQASRTNVFHLPVRGSGDGGIYSTAADFRSLWTAFFAGRIVSLSWVEQMVRPRSDAETKRYGLGFWLHSSTDTVILEGMDAGVSFRSLHDPRSDADTHRHLEHDRRGVADHSPTLGATRGGPARHILSGGAHSHRRERLVSSCCGTRLLALSLERLAAPSYLVLLCMALRAMEAVCTSTRT